MEISLYDIIMSGRASPPGSLSQTDYRALSDFRYQIRRFLRFSEEAAAAEGLEPQQHQMLLAIQGLDDPGGPTVGRLAEYLMIRHHSAVGMLDRLEERGLVERVRGDGDRRQVRVVIAAEGLRTLKRLSNLHREELRQSGPELVETLRRIVENRLEGAAE
jgi:DNA-binding MarR family transcriptional regulator